MSRQDPQASRQGDGDDPIIAARRKRLEGVRDRLLAEPRNVDALCQAATILQDLGRFDEAVAHLERAADVCRGASPASRCQVLTQLANCFAAGGNHDRAERWAHAALAAAPDQAGPYLALATLALERGATDQAERYYRVARELRPEHSEAHAALAMIRQQAGQYEEAFELYLDSLRCDTDNLVALLGLFQTSCQMGDFSQIIHYLELYLAGHDGDASVQFCLATLYARQGRLGEARDMTLKVLAAEPLKQDAVELLVELQDALAEAGCR